MVVESSVVAPRRWRMWLPFFMALGVAPSVSAQVVFNVNSTADQLDDNAGTGVFDGVCHTTANTCTLRAAVMEAVRVSGVGATIVVPAGTYTFTRGPTGVADEKAGDLDLTAPTAGNPIVTFSGAGAASTIIDANQLDRVIRVYAGRTVNIAGITLRNGISGFGGAIFNLGTLTLTQSAIRASAATSSFGGAIFNFTAATLVLDRTALEGNVAAYGGGALGNDGTAHVLQSSLAGNATNYGGGIFNQGTLFVTNSTISGNRSWDDGGGIYNLFVAHVYNSTIAFNEANADADAVGGDGAGIHNSFAFNLRNSVVAGNYLAGAPDYDDCTGPLYSLGRNKFWAVSGCQITQAGAGNFTFLASLDELGPLQDNGGPTRTHALRAPSDMIDGADTVEGCRNNFGLLATDQRGAPRIAGAGCDIGAFEFGASLPGPLFAGSFEQGEP